MMNCLTQLLHHSALKLEKKVQFGEVIALIASKAKINGFEIYFRKISLTTTFYYMVGPRNPSLAKNIMI